ncbi:MAG: HEPN domain-containing protein [Fimbriimonadaceae bacterium]|nr:HEPN domain-containing protein [Fimbriimonadaceae bacterium]
MSAMQREWAVGWMDKSRSDLRAIDALLGVKPPILDLARYRATQAAEKAPKGLIVANGQPPHKTHDLLRPADLVPVVAPEAVLRWCEEILPYS